MLLIYFSRTIYQVAPTVWVGIILHFGADIFPESQISRSLSSTQPFIKFLPSSCFRLYPNPAYTVASSWFLCSSEGHNLPFLSRYYYIGLSSVHIGWYQKVASLIFYPPCKTFCEDEARWVRWLGRQNSWLR